jgi:hypothetical protein
MTDDEWKRFIQVIKGLKQRIEDGPFSTNAGSR